MSMKGESQAQANTVRTAAADRGDYMNGLKNIGFAIGIWFLLQPAVSYAQPEQPTTAGTTAGILAESQPVAVAVVYCRTSTYFEYRTGRRFTRKVTKQDGGVCVVNREYYDKDWVLVKAIAPDGREVTTADTQYPRGRMAGSSPLGSARRGSSHIAVARK